LIVLGDVKVGQKKVLIEKNLFANQPEVFFPK
jgi:hypothetical protein